MAAVRGMASMQPWCGSKYAIGPELGRGGMATVHFGLLMGDLGFGRVVAIKRIHPRLAADREMVAHLRDEARVAARIRHPNVVSVLDVVAVGGEVGIVLDYVHGESLSALRKRARARGDSISVGVCVAIAIDVLHGLDAAHNAKNERGELLNVVHRDVSPQNVLVGLDGVARVLDFGIAKANNRSQVTRDGAVKGKLAYMAPEQISGEVSAQSDVYALGLVLWELLVGEGPFAGAATDTELVGLVLKGTIVPPSKERPEVSAALDDIVLRALAPVASSRYANASEMAQALERTGLGATRAELTRFVADFAEESIAKRAAIVEAIEARPPIASPADAAPVDAAPADAAPDEATTMKGVTGPSGGEARAEPRSRAYFWSLVLALIVAVTLLLGVAMMSSVDARARPERAAASAAVSSAEPSRSPAPPATASQILPPPSAPVAASARNPAPAVRRGTPRGPDCAIPYTFDPDGKKLYRRECFPQ